MHAVVVRVTISDPEGSGPALREQGVADGADNVHVLTDAAGTGSWTSPTTRRSTPAR
jgi:hypothetical protein